ncbi:zinc finger matrin-type protein 3-like [Teleopsis dalmanni]|uniref:zinc finger matrin-type protein 3-like n=1 Tax=Teleopsis dalmanni TaxID=139649 RepID=UPI0018CE21BE|nr:zinc finger matrin-type protein 3-like [Teleopsis dalmanni]
MEDSGFLRGYTIPTIQRRNANGTTHMAPSTHYSDYNGDYISAQVAETDRNVISNRFIPPGKHDTNYIPPKVQKRKYASGPGVKEQSTAIFVGRDVSYPEELNAIIQPLRCDLCKTSMNSLQNAKDHYESKAHDRNITNWLTRNYVEKNLEPPEVKRFYKRGPAGPEAFHCDACDLKLTSLTHANQHYAGRKHRLVISNISKPSGAGFYNAEGKWVRTATKVSGQIISQDGRFGIGESFSSELVTQNAAEIKTENLELKIKDFTNLEAPLSVPRDANQYCEICKINVTSHAQMVQHLEGLKHRKKLNIINGTENETKEITNNANTILTHINDKEDSTTDYSMYRTPSGSYYCQTCNIIMSHTSALQQHLEGKKHIKKSAEENLKVKPE